MSSDLKRYASKARRDKVNPPVIKKEPLFTVQQVVVSIFVLLLVAGIYFAFTPSNAVLEARQEVENSSSVTVSFVSLPTNAVVGVPVTVSWIVNAAGVSSVSHTAVHYDTGSFPGSFGVAVDPQQAGYNILSSEYASGDFNIPASFNTSIVFDSVGSYYLRAHAVHKNKNFWTDEVVVDVV